MGICEITGQTTEDLLVKSLFFRTVPWDEKVRQQIFELFSESTSSSAKVCELNFVIGRL